MAQHFRKCFLALFALVLVLGASTPAFAQTGGITGRVTNTATGAPLPSARVEAVTAGGQVAAAATTDNEGQYRLTGLQPGTYAIVVSLVGYQTQRIEGVRVVSGQNSMQAVTLAALAFELNPIIVSASKRQEKVLDAPASVAVIDARTVAERPRPRRPTTSGMCPASTSPRRACSRAPSSRAGSTTSSRARSTR